MTGAWYARGICDPGCRTREGKCSNLDGLGCRFAPCSSAVVKTKNEKNPRKMTRDSGVPNWLQPN